MQQRLEKLFNRFPALSGHDSNDKEEWQKLDGVTPNCTTKTNSPSVSLERARRKKLRNTQTISCVKELVVDGKHYIYKETNVTDDKGALLSQSKSYQSFFIKTSNSTASASEDSDLVKY